MREKAEILFDAITGIREDLVEEAQDYVFRRRVRWRRFAGLAACLALAVFAGFFGLLSSGGMGGGSDAGAPPASMDAAPAEDSGAPEYAGENEGEAAPLLAHVLAVSERWVLVSPLPGEVFSGPVRVRTEDVPGLPALHPGDLVSISYTGTLQDSYPPGLRAAAVEVVEAYRQRG